jgi:transcriptional regulator with XRE-family HTH domain
MSPKEYNSATTAELGEEVKLLIQLRGWSKAKLAEEMCVNRRTVSYWVSGERRIPYYGIEYLRALSDLEADNRELKLAISSIASIMKDDEMDPLAVRPEVKLARIKSILDHH